MCALIAPYRRWWCQQPTPSNLRLFDFDRSVDESEILLRCGLVGTLARMFVVVERVWHGNGVANRVEGG